MVRVINLSGGRQLRDASQLAAILLRYFYFLDAAFGLQSTCGVPT